MVEKRGVSFSDPTWDRLAAKIGDEDVSPFVDNLVLFGLDAEVELAVRGIHIDDPAERREFLLDRLEEGLDAWNA